ncbi:MAG TPA: hypothetical protein VFZ01_18985 [Geminicoccaceae bacterium]
MAAETTGSFEIGRVLAVLRASSVSPDILACVVDVAARLDAELEALVLLDPNLLTLAELPFALQMVPHHPGPRPLRRNELELEFKAIMGGARRRLETLAAARGVRWSLRTLHARPVEALVAAAEQADLLVIEAGARLAGRAIRPHIALPALIAGISRPVLLVPPGRRAGGPIYVVADPGVDSVRALQAARCLARQFATQLTVLRPPPEAERHRHPPLDARAAAGPGPLTGAAALNRLLAEVGTGILVMPALSRWLEEPGAFDRLARAAATIVLTR